MNQAVSERQLAPSSPVEVDGIAVASTTLANVFKAAKIPSSDGNFIFGHLRLPEYQRPYRWGEEQLSRLLDDLRAFSVLTSRRTTFTWVASSFIRTAAMRVSAAC